MPHHLDQRVLDGLADRREPDVLVRAERAERDAHRVALLTALDVRHDLVDELAELVLLSGETDDVIALLERRHDDGAELCSELDDALWGGL